MISAMTETTFDSALTIRTVASAKRALDHAVADLRAGEIRFKGQKVTKEAVVNALWLAIADIEPTRLERWLVPYVAKLEVVMRREPAASDDDGPPIPTSPPAEPRQASVILPKAQADEAASRGRKRKSS